jgi:hypothetical protein
MAADIPLSLLFQGVTAFGALGTFGAALKTWKETKRNGRLLIGEDDVEQDDGILGAVEEQERRVEHVEERTGRMERAMRHSDSITFTEADS